MRARTIAVHRNRSATLPARRDGLPGLVGVGGTLSRRRVLAGGSAALLAATLPPAIAAPAQLSPTRPAGAPNSRTAAALDLTALTDAALGALAVRRTLVCRLECPTGRIVACDPLVSLGDWKPFALTVPAGRHPVFSYVDLDNDGGVRVGLAELRLSEAPVARWQIALADATMLPQMVGDTVWGYPVDAGMGCFCDEATRDAIRFADEVRQFFSQGSYSEAELLEAALKVRDGAEHRLAFDPARNIALFASGYGDGYYATCWGFGPDGAPSRLVTSFDVFGGVADATTPNVAPPGMNLSKES